MPSAFTNSSPQIIHLKTNEQQDNSPQTIQRRTLHRRTIHQKHFTATIFKCNLQQKNSKIGQTIHRKQFTTGEIHYRSGHRRANSPQPIHLK
jgi:hypothetical protein